MAATAWCWKLPSISANRPCAPSRWIIRRPGARPGCHRHRPADLGAGRPGPLGRIINVIGEPVDEAGPVKAEKKRAIHQEAPTYTDQSTEAQILDHRHQGRRSARALRQGRQDRPVRRRRRRQDRADHGTDQQRRQGARRLFGVRRRRRAHARRQRPLSRDDRIRRQQGPARRARSTVRNARWCTAR